MTHSSLPATVVSAQKMPHAQKDDILAYAREIFGDPQKTHSWLTTPNPVFRGMRPKDLIAIGDSIDLSDVCDELGRIDHGVF